MPQGLQRIQTLRARLAVLGHPNLVVLPLLGSGRSCVLPMAGPENHLGKPQRP